MIIRTVINLLKILLRAPLRTLLKFLYGNNTKSKPLNGTSMIIHYPPYQHLSFFGKYTVDYEKQIMDYLKSREKPRVKNLNLDAVSPGKAISELTDAERDVVRNLLRMTFDNLRGSND